MTAPTFDLMNQQSDLAQFLLHTVEVSGEEERLLDSLPHSEIVGAWLDNNVAWIAANPAAWQRVDLNWEF